MALPRNFQSFSEFERDYIRTSNRLGMSLEDLMEDTAFDTEIELDHELTEVMEDSDKY